MEEVLDVYEREYKANKPVICLDERPCQLIDDIIVPLPMKPGRVTRQDYHYQRNGTCVVFLAIEPLTGKRIVKVTQRKTKKDYALFMKELSEAYLDSEKLTVVQDNLNTHKPSSFYENFEAS